MLPGIIPVPVILALGAPVGPGVTGTPIGMLLAVTQTISGGGDPGGPGTIGEAAGLLLALTKAS